LLILTPKGHRAAETLRDGLELPFNHWKDYRWFRLALLPQKASRYEVPSIRRLILNVPGNIVGNGRYRHVGLAPNKRLQELVCIIKTKLQKFIRQRAWVLANSS
jgi:hypothetical protein